MRKVLMTVIAAAVCGILSACATTEGWGGAEAEVAYEAQAKARSNNDDYYELIHDGRLYAFSDLADYQNWHKIGEIPLVVTLVGAGPNGETVKLQLNKSDAKAMEKIPGYKGATQLLYEGELIGLEQGFYGEIVSEDRYWVFESGADLREFKKSGEAPCGVTHIGAGPQGKTVVFVQSCKAAAKGKPQAIMARFVDHHALSTSAFGGAP
ncbi:MAG: hypothetical protein ACT4PG_04050 [Panacagrimonas sp.]